VYVVRHDHDRMKLNSDEWLYSAGVLAYKGNNSTFPQTVSKYDVATSLWNYHPANGAEGYE